MPTQVRLLLVDDNLILRSGMRALLKTEPSFDVVGEADDGEAAIRLAHDLVPDVIVMDVQMPGMDGIEATRQIMRAASPKAKPIVIAVSAASEEKPMLDAGAVSFMQKDRIHELILVIKNVLSGRAA